MTLSIHARFLLALVCLLAQSACVPAMLSTSPGVAGQVTDARTHRPVAQARIEFPQYQIAATTTDAQGRFVVPHHQQLGLLFWGFDYAPYLQLQITHPHYKTYYQSLPLRATDYRVDAPLVPSP